MEFPIKIPKQSNEFPFNPFSLTWGSSSFVFQIFFQDLCLFSFYLLMLLTFKASSISWKIYMISFDSKVSL